MFFNYSALPDQILTSRLRLKAFFLAAIVLAFGAACTVSEQRFPGFHESVVTIAGKAREIEEPFGIAFHKSILYVSDGGTGRILKIGSDGSISTFAAGLDTPSGIAFGPDGRLYVADAGSHTIKAIDEGGGITTVAGIDHTSGSDDGPTSTATFRAPVGIAVSEDGKIFVADTYNDRIRVIENGTVRTLAGSTRGFQDGPQAKFDTPLGIAAWHGGRLLVADSGNRRIRAILPDGSVSTLAGGADTDEQEGTPNSVSLERPAAVAVSPAGMIYITDSDAVKVIGRRTFPFVETISETRRGLADGAARRARFNRPSGIAATADEVYIADSDNQLVRKFTNDGTAAEITAAEIEKLRYSAAEFRSLGPARWPYDPPERTREIAGTLGEIRGEITTDRKPVWFHNGLDIVGAFGETARFIRDEKVLDPGAVENFSTLRELIRMPTIGYIHINIGRSADGRAFADDRFIFEYDGDRPGFVRVPRGTRFRAGEPIGTLNAMNHVHLIAGRPGAEMNALDALVLPGISDGIAPTIESVAVVPAGSETPETLPPDGRIRVSDRFRVVVRTHDRTDGNEERRRLAPYRVGLTVSRPGQEPAVPAGWNISFAKMPVPDAVRYVYWFGSRSGATGITIFDMIATNLVDGYIYEERFIDPATLEPGPHTIRVFVGDFFGNVATKDISIEVNK